MRPERWEKLVSTFHQLHERSEPERIALLERTRITDPDLIVELERMLGEEQASDGFLERPPDLAAVHRVRQISPGDSIGHYRILSLLGGGGMGIVYSAHDTRLNRVVALKFLAPYPVGSGLEKDRFVREAQAAAAIHHPNVCPVYEIDEVDGSIFIAMALLEGQSLAQRITAGTMEVEEAVRLALQTAAGLQAAHAHGIIHHDIKPANLIVTSGSDLRSHVTLMDFGIAQKTGPARGGEDCFLAGTISYMSPERVSGSVVDSRTDMWSFGVVLFEMLTGRKPFTGPTDRAVMEAILHHTPPAPSSVRPGIPVELDRIVAKALAKDPNRRYATATELIGDLGSVATLESSGAAVSAQRVSFFSRSQVAALAAVGIAAISSLWWWPSRLTSTSSVESKAPVMLQMTAQLPENRVTTAAISPDGNQLAYGTIDGIFVQSVGTGETRLLRSPRISGPTAYAGPGTATAFWSAASHEARCNPESGTCPYAKRRQHLFSPMHAIRNLPGMDPESHSPTPPARSSGWQTPMGKKRGGSSPASMNG